MGLSAAEVNPDSPVIFAARGGPGRGENARPAAYAGLPIIPSSALISTAAMPTGTAIFQPTFINWS